MNVTRNIDVKTAQPKINNAFFIYSVYDEGILRELVEEIRSYFEVEFPVWSYVQDLDNESLFENKLVPDLENADFVVLLFTRHSVEDPFFFKMFTEAANRNKTLVPLLYGISEVPSSKFRLWTKAYDWNDSHEKDDALILLHSLFGLPQKGDAVGALVVLYSDVPCKVYREIEFLVEIGEGPEAVSIRLAQGNHLIRFVSDTGLENKYIVRISSNKASSFTLRNKMQILEQIDSTGHYPCVDGEVDYDADLPDDNRYELFSSSLDQKKLESIVEDFSNMYDSQKLSIPPKPSLEDIRSHSCLVNFGKYFERVSTFVGYVMMIYPMWKLLVFMFYCILAVCTLFIMLFYWNPIPEAWEELKEAFVIFFILGWAGVLVLGAIGALIYLILLGIIWVWKRSAYRSQVMKIKVKNSIIASNLNEELKDILLRHKMRIAKIRESQLVQDQ